MFGAFCPFPLRLGGTAETGVSAVQWLRLCADVAAMSSPRPLAWLTYDCAATPTVVAYRGVNGEGIGNAPSIAYVSAGIVDITWDSVYTDDHGNVREFSAMFGTHGGHDYGGTTLTNTGSVTCNRTATIRVEAHNTTDTPTNGRVTVAVWGTYGELSLPSEYGGDRNKRDDERERVPYAWTAYLEYTDALGSAFSKERTGYIHARKLASARRTAAERRLQDRSSANSYPGSASDMLDHWREVMNVRVPATTDEQTRLACVSRLAASRGPSDTAIDEAVTNLLGEALVGITRYYGADISDAPTGTFWHGGTPGPTSMDMGGGAWIGPRSHLFVSVTRPHGMSEIDFDNLMNVQLSQMLDTLLPPHATFDWGTNTDTGFILGDDPDESLLGFDAL